MKNLLLIAGDYTNDLAKKLIENNVVDNIFCLVYSPVINGKIGSLSDNPRIKYYCIEDYESYEAYDEICDMNSLPALSEKIMVAMLPYESMALRLGRRKDNYPTIEYEQEKRFYLKALRYWNAFIINNKINYTFNDRCPHYRYAYIIYGLAQVYRIHTLLLTTTSISGLMTHMASIETTGLQIKRMFESLDPSSDYNLSGNVLEFYSKYTKPVATIKSHKRKENEQNRKDVERDFFGSYTGIKGFFKIPKLIIHDYLSVSKDKRNQEIKKRSAYYKWKQGNGVRIRYYIRHEAMSIKQYNVFATNPDLNEKYIYFALQLTPEETIMPRAGVFSDQFNSIQLLARAAQKLGVYVYVKEHFVQAYREKDFYDTIRTIPNVRLINSDIFSFDLIKNCIAVATQTGTCIIEGVLAKKPAIVFGDGYVWKGMPYVYKMEDEDSGKEIIESILDIQDFDDRAVLRYFYAIEKSTFNLYPPKSAYDIDNDDYRNSLEQLVQLLTKFLYGKVFQT